MIRRSFVLLAVAALAACASHSQEADGRPEPRTAPAAERRFPNPVSLLIERKDSLQLNELQLETLREVEADLRSKNDPLLKQLPEGGPGGGGRGMGGRGGGMGMRSGGGMGGAPGGGGRRGGGGGADAGKMREIIQQVEENNNQALDRAYAVMTEEQATRARAWIDARRAARRQMQSSPQMQPGDLPPPPPQQ